MEDYAMGEGEAVAPKHPATCPYCAEQFLTAALEGPDKPRSELLEVVCVPYTRDVGRYDPKDADQWLDPGGWTRIGADFLPLWERIGILRITRAGVDVRYRVQGCLSCGSLFDMYANYNPDGQLLGDLWPHLFGPDPAGPPGGIRAYWGESWPIRLVRDFGRLLRSTYLGAVLVAVLMFGAGSWPWLVRLDGPLPDHYAATRGLYLTVYGIAALGCTLLMLVSERFIRFLETTPEFGELFRIHPSRIFGLTHWRNFTLSRFVGVQPERGLPRPTQVDIIAGGLAQLMAVIWWVSLKRAWAALAFGLGSLAAGLLLYLLLLRIRRAAEARGAGAVLRSVFLLAVISLSLVGLASIWRTLSAPWRGALWRILQVNFDLMFWLLVAFLVGTAAWLALNSTAYVLQGITRIPMRLDPWEAFAHARPLRTLQRYSTGMMLTLFGVALTLVSAFAVAQNLPGLEPVVAELDWLLAWLRWSLALLFTAVALGLGEMNFVGITLLYVLLAFGLSGSQFRGGGFILDGRVVSLGVFFTLMLVYHLVFTDRLIDRLLLAARDDVISQINGLIQGYRRQVAELKLPMGSVLRSHTDQLPSTVPVPQPALARAAAGPATGIWGGIQRLIRGILGIPAARPGTSEKAHNRLQALQAIQQLLLIRKQFEEISVSASAWPRLVQSFAPFLGSVLLPLFLERLLAEVFPNIFA